MLCRPYGADLLEFTFPTGVDTPAYSVSPYGLIINPHSVFYSFISYSISSFRAPSPHPGLAPGSQPILPQQIADQVRDKGGTGLQFSIINLFQHRGTEEEVKSEK